MSEVKVNKLTPRTNCGTVTFGDSGDTFNIPAGVTISNSGTATGFGATGAVSWDTSAIKTVDFTATAGVGYFVDTATTGAVAVTLPASPTAGDVIGVSDYANNFETANCTLNRNGSNIAGQAVNGTLSTDGVAVTLVYVDATKGWIVTDSGNQNDAPTSQFVAATGGCITTCGNFKVHVFTGPGTFTVSCAGNAQGSNSVDYVVVAGGGGGAKGTGPDGAGGAGAGGMRLSNSAGCVPAPTMSPLVAPTNLPVSVQGYPITVGGGGAGHTPCGPGGPTGVGVVGDDSTFSTITSAGGGYGAYGAAGGAGGSGGGAHQNTKGSGNTPPVSPPQGNDGGGGPPYPPPGGGGGGAGYAAIQADGTGGPPRGATWNPSQGGDGGDGSYVADSFIGPTAPSYGTAGLVTCTRYFAGGGGGGPSPSRGGQSNSNGGQGGGANGVASTKTPGTINTGGGGAGNEAFGGGNGGSGIVIIRYKYQ
jgi:hypothetical protein